MNLQVARTFIFFAGWLMVNWMSSEGLTQPIDRYRQCRSTDRVLQDHCIMRVAIEIADAPRAKAIIKNGIIDINFRDSHYLFLSLQVYSTNPAEREIIIALLDAGARPDGQNVLAGGFDYIVRATADRPTEEAANKALMIRLLRGIDVNKTLTYSFGNIPFFQTLANMCRSRIERRREIGNWLLFQVLPNADLSATSFPGGNTIAHRLAYDASSEQCLTALNRVLALGANVEIKNASSMRVIDAAVSYLVGAPIPARGFGTCTRDARKGSRENIAIKPFKVRAENILLQRNTPPTAMPLRDYRCALSSS